MSYTGEQNNGPNQSFPESIPEHLPFDHLLTSQILSLCIDPTSGNKLDGTKRSYYFNLDNLTFGNPESNPQLEPIREQFFDNLKAVFDKLQQAHPLDAIAYFVRDASSGAPFGVQHIAHTFHDQLEVPQLLVNPSLRGRKTIATRNIADMLPNRASVALITDYTASGDEVLRSALKLFSYSVGELHVLSIFDSGEDAREKLYRNGIPLTTIMSDSDLK